MAEKGFFAKILNGELPEAPISKLLGWKYLEFDPSSQVLKVEMQLDETLSPTLALTLGPGEFAPTLEIKVNFISPAKVGRGAGYRPDCKPRAFHLLPGRPVA